MLEWRFPAWDEAKRFCHCEKHPALQAGTPLVIEFPSRDFLGFFRFLFVTCSLFVIHSVGGVLGSQQVQRNLFVGEEPFTNTSHFLKDCA